MPSENKLGALISPSFRSFSRALGDWKISYITTNGHLEDCFSRVDKKRFQFLPNDDQQYEYRYVLHTSFLAMLFLLCTDVQSGKFADLSQEAWKYGAKNGMGVHTAKNHWPLNWLAFDFRQRQRQTQTQTQKTLGRVSWFCDYLDKVDDSWQIEKL